jgi:D-arabinose 1-dehydrogenase-like Zn-dependent alcohol dehydrogenase
MIRGRDNPNLEIVRSFDGGRDLSTQNLIKGVWKHGSYEEKLLAPLEGLFKIPEEWVQDQCQGGKGFRIQDFALSGYYLLAIGGLATSGVGAGDRVIIAPATGNYSSAAVRVALAMGCKVVAASRSAGKLKMLEKYHGAKDKLSTVVLTGDTDDDTKALKNAIGGNGADVFVDYSPTTIREEPPYLKAGFNSLRRGGEYLLLGGALTDLKISYVDIMRRELRIRGKFMWQREHVELFLRLIDTGSLRLGVEAGVLDDVITFGMDEVEAALKESRLEHGEERLFTFQ